MTKRLGILVTTALAGGTMLVTACGQVSEAGRETASSSAVPTSTSASGTESAVPTSTTSTTSTTGASGSPAGGGVEPVACGSVTFDTGARHTVIADPAANGLVGCMEAVNVADEFRMLPPEKRSEASLGNVTLSDGWSCTLDDGETASLGCVKGRVGEEFGLAFHTEPLAA